MLVLEDGPSNGFVRSTKVEGLNLAESLVAVEKLATLHAASAVYFAKVSAPDDAMLALPPNYKLSLCPPQSPAAVQLHFGQSSLLAESPSGGNFFREALACFVDNAESMKIPGSVVQKLRALQPRLLTKSAEDYAASLNGFVVLNHGSVWSNNILFQYRNGEPVEALLVRANRTVLVALRYVTFRCACRSTSRTCLSDRRSST